MSVRTSLQKLIHFPILVSQVTGSFPFKYGLHANLEFGWLSWPTLIHLVKLVVGCFTIIVLYCYKKEYISVLGGWSKIDMITFFLIGTVGLIADICTAVITLKERNHILKYHSDIIEFVMDIFSASSPTERQEQGEWLNGKKNWLERGVWTIVFFAVVGYIGLLLSSFILGIILEKSSWIMITLPLITYVVMPLHILRNIQFLLITGALMYIWLGMRILRYRLHRQTFAGNPINMEAGLHQLKRAYDLVEQFNVRFQWQLAVGTLYLLISILATFNKFCSWLAVTGPMSALVIFPAMIPSFLTLFSICTVASQIHQEGRRCIESLRDLGAYGWIQKTVPLMRQLRLYHAAEALYPTMVEPGHFFTLGRNLIPSVSCFV